MRTFEHASTTDHLGRYYTQTAISSLLVGLLPSACPGSVLDLGSGEGSLTVAASSKWTDASMITVDVDADASRVLARLLKRSGFIGLHHHLHNDALSTELPFKLAQSNQSMPGIAVCNPPFLVPRWRKDFSAILEDVGFSGSMPAITSTDAAVLFLSQNIRLISQGGSIGIVVPDSLVSAEKYLGFRTALLNKYEVVQAIRLPRGSFAGTDALAHILIISKRSPTNDLVQLSCVSNKSGPVLTMKVRRDLAIRRLDYACHAVELSQSGEKNKLADVVIDLRRGTLNSAQVRASKSFVLHTSDIARTMLGQWSNFGRKAYVPAKELNGTVIAEPGDLILARVGRNAAEKIIGVASGRVALSDCLFRLRVQTQFRDEVLTWLASERAQRWLDDHSRGVAARHITKSDLLNLPISFQRE